MSQRTTRRPLAAAQRSATKPVVSKRSAPSPTAPARPGAAAPADSDPRIDAYIARSAPFAQPILKHLRALVHAACPDVKETMKWSRPFYLHHGILCMMAAFKEHCHYGLWSHLVVHGQMDQRLRRITAVSDLPPRSEMLSQLRAAAAANAAGTGISALRRPPAARLRAPASVPEDLREALTRAPAAARAFAAFPPGRRREYIDWLNQAKREATRASRLAQALEWISQGKSRNWKYGPA